MSQIIQAIRGMNDILPEQTPYWQFLEQQLHLITRSYGYDEIRMPIVEQTALFKRGIGEATDIVEKEMYTFADRNNDSLTLRPEGTASCVRAGIEHGLLYNQQHRLWYLGPMFRHERPQKGRYRQFYQFGVEAFGMPGPDIDAEIIFMMARLWRLLGIQDHVVLQLNSLGTHESRACYREKLVDYFQQHYDILDEDSCRRLSVNPLRILDSKHPQMQSLIAQAPVLTDYLDDVSASHFNQLQEYLNKAGVAYELNPRLVRGLDYYSHTVFEWVTDQLGSQSAICSGGRYDSLVELLGGKATSAVGFAMGLERVIALLAASQPMSNPPDAYLIMAGEKAEKEGLLLAEQLRSMLPNMGLMVNCGGGNIKNQFKRADKSGARWAFILGENELLSHTIAIKFLREEREQLNLTLDELAKFLADDSGAH